MKTITVQRTLKAPIDQVFDVLADHANYRNFPGVKASKLLKEGKKDKNGVGAVRLEPRENGCEVTWTTTVGVKIPLIGGLLDGLLLPQLERGLAGTLRHIERRLSA